MVKIFNPRQTVLISCRGRREHLGRTEELDDLFPLDWHSPASWDPPVYAILVSKKLVALELIRSSGVFVVNFMPFGLVDAVIAAGKHTSEFHEKWEEIGLRKNECEKLVDCPRVAESAGWLECQMQNELDCGDHVLIIGRVAYSHLERDVSRTFHIDGTHYTTTRE